MLQSIYVIDGGTGYVNLLSFSLYRFDFSFIKIRQSFFLFFLSAEIDLAVILTISLLFCFLFLYSDVLLEKHYKGIINRSGVEFFWDEVMKRGKRDDVPPFLVSPKYYMASIYRDGIYLLALMTGEMQSLFVLEFLHRVFDVYVSYFGNVNARSITDNFSTAYQLLEEMLDNVSIIH